MDRKVKCYNKNCYFNVIDDHCVSPDEVAVNCNRRIKEQDERLCNVTKEKVMSELLKMDFSEPNGRLFQIEEIDGDLMTIHLGVNNSDIHVVCRIEKISEFFPG